MPGALHSAHRDPGASPGLMLWRVTNAWQRTVRAALAPFGLTHVQFVLLAVLTAMDPSVAVTQRGLNACIVHPSGILGPNDYAVGEVTKTVIEIVNGEMPVGMQGSFNLCDVRDLAYGCIMAADKGRKGECYILGNEEVTLKEMCRMLQNDLGCKPIKFYLPLSVASFIAKRMEKKAKKSGKQPLMTSFSVYNLARNNTFDYSKAQKELGYKTRPYAETLHDEAHWLKREGKIKATA